MNDQVVKLTLTFELIFSHCLIWFKNISSKDVGFISIKKDFQKCSSLGALGSKFNHEVKKVGQG